MPLDCGALRSALQQLRGFLQRAGSEADKKHLLAEKTTTSDITIPTVSHIMNQSQSHREKHSEERSVLRKTKKSGFKARAHPAGQPISSIFPRMCVEGTVTHIANDKVFVNIGEEHDGILLLDEGEKCPFERYDLVKGLMVVGRKGGKIRLELARDPIDLEVLLLSGLKLTSLRSYPSWTAADVKLALRPFLQRGHVVSNLLCGSQMFDSSMTVSDLGLTSGSNLLAVVQACDYFVENAGKSEVNGHYKKTGEHMNGAPTYTNESGVLLFRHVFPNDVAYWYFSLGEDVAKKAGDFYRVKTEDMHPPVAPADWTIYNSKTGKVECPLGDNVFPVVSRISAAGDDDVLLQESRGH